MKPEFLMLSQTYKNQHVGGWWASEKLDGCRAFWDGGVSRGILAANVPYANTEKDYRLKRPPKATGLWSRSGKVIHAPDWWLDQLPFIPLDGELFLGRGRFQELRTIVGAEERNWQDVKYKVFDSPTWHAFGRPRDIKIRNEYTFSIKDVFTWMSPVNLGRLPFDLIQKHLVSKCHGICQPLLQTKLPFVGFKEVVDEMLLEVTKDGGEGVMLRKESCVWLPERSHNLLKYKPWHDAEGVVTGFTTGKGKYLGMIGALILDFNDKRLELSGLTDQEREFETEGMRTVATCYDGKDMPSTAQGAHFKVGDTVTFRYRELSDDGIPKEARYWRQHDIQ